MQGRRVYCIMLSNVRKSEHAVDPRIITAPIVLPSITFDWHDNLLLNVYFYDFPAYVTARCINRITNITGEVCPMAASVICHAF